MEIVICEEPLTTLSPPANNTLDSESLTPAFQKSFVESQTIEPVAVFGAVASFTYNPPLEAALPFNSSILSPICTVVESTIVWVPLTVRLPGIVTLPLNVTLAPLAVNACFNEDEYEFNSVTEVFKLAVVKFIFVIETPCESFVVFAADADAIKLPLTTPISVNLSFAEPVNVFKALVDTFEDV